MGGNAVSELPSLIAKGVTDPSVAESRSKMGVMTMSGSKGASLQGPEEKANRVSQGNKGGWADGGGRPPQCRVTVKGHRFQTQASSQTESPLTERGAEFQEENSVTPLQVCVTGIDLQAHFGDAGSVPGHSDKANTVVKWVKWIFWFPNAYKVIFT